MNSPVAVVGAGGVTRFGDDLLGLASAISQPEMFHPSRQLAPYFANVPSAEVDQDPAADLGTAKQRKLMSRSAKLLLRAVHGALQGAAWVDCTNVGFYCGVGASDSSMTELSAMLTASMKRGRLSIQRFGKQGLGASNPLQTFKFLNNFTMCHSAIASGVSGPNGVYFSRGAGTVVALLEACHAVTSGACERVLAGAADSAHHPAVWAELARDGREGLVAGEGAGVLALTSTAAKPLAWIEDAFVYNVRQRSLFDATCAALDRVGESPQHVVIAPWGTLPRGEMRESIARLWPHANVVDASAALGESLAASVALAWLVGLDLLHNTRARCVVLNAGVDEHLGATVLSTEVAR